MEHGENILDSSIVPLSRKSETEIGFPSNLKIESLYPSSAKVQRVLQFRVNHSREGDEVMERERLDE